MKISKEQQNEIRYEEKKTLKRRGIDYLWITVAAAIYSVSVSLFLDPNSLAPGGVTGIAIILNRITGLETGTWMFAVNIPILVMGMWKFGWRFILSTLYCTLLMSGFTNFSGTTGSSDQGSPSGGAGRRLSDGCEPGNGIQGRAPPPAGRISLSSFCVSGFRI